MPQSLVKNVRHLFSAKLYMHANYRNSNYNHIEACSNGEIRLEGGSTNNEGRVEMCRNRCWGTIQAKNPSLVGEAVCQSLYILCFYMHTSYITTITPTLKLALMER